MGLLPQLFINTCHESTNLFLPCNRNHQLQRNFAPILLRCFLSEPNRNYECFSATRSAYMGEEAGKWGLQKQKGYISASGED